LWSRWQPQTIDVCRWWIGVVLLIIDEDRIITVA